jgi:hypothetical protein
MAGQPFDRLIFLMPTSRLQLRALARYNTSLLKSISVHHDMEGAIAVFWN